MGVLLQWEFTFYLTSIAVARRISLQALFWVSTLWVPAVQSPWPLLYCAIKTTYREGRRILTLVLSSHHCWSDNLYLPLHGHESSSSSKDATNRFIFFATKELPSNNHILLPTLSYKQAKTWEQSVYYLLLRDFWCWTCPVPKVSVTKNPRDAETRSGKHQLGSNERVSTFPKVCRFTYVAQLQRPQLSMQKAWRHLVPASPALPNITSAAPQACVSRTCNHQPPRAVSCLGRTHPNTASYILSPSWRGNFGSLHLRLWFCPAVGNMPL